MVGAPAISCGKTAEGLLNQMAWLTAVALVYFGWAANSIWRDLVRQEAKSDIKSWIGRNVFRKHR
jgi:hypothetical protein